VFDRRIAFAGPSVREGRHERHRSAGQDRRRRRIPVPASPR
jgi:hypothetical protein